MAIFNILSELTDLFFLKNFEISFKRFCGISANKDFLTSHCCFSVKISLNNTDKTVRFYPSFFFFLITVTRGKSLLESWGITFLPD